MANVQMCFAIFATSKCTRRRKLWSNAFEAHYIYMVINMYVDRK